MNDKVHPRVCLVDRSGRLFRQIQTVLHKCGNHEESKPTGIHMFLSGHIKINRNEPAGELIPKRIINCRRSYKLKIMKKMFKMFHVIIIIIM